MHQYRTHNCGQLNITNIDSQVRLSGWMQSKRDHGGLLFIDLRDQYGLTQVVVDQSNKVFKTLEELKVESVITITGKVVKRSEDTINNNISTGSIEVVVEKLDILSSADILPMQVLGNESYGDEIRLRNRFLDLRRLKMKENIAVVLILEGFPAEALPVIPA